VSFVAVAEQGEQRVLHPSVISQKLRPGLHSAVFINVPGVQQGDYIDPRITKREGYYAFIK